MDYMWLYGLYVVLWVMWGGCFLYVDFSNIKWFIFKTSIAERNFHLINRSPMGNLKLLTNTGDGKVVCKELWK